MRFQSAYINTCPKYSLLALVENAFWHTTQCIQHYQTFNGSPQRTMNTQDVGCLEELTSVKQIGFVLWHIHLGKFLQYAQKITRHTVSGKTVIPT